jgi:hypothetical protein
VKAASRAADLTPSIAEMRAGEATSLRAIARELDGCGITAPRAGLWSADRRSFRLRALRQFTAKSAQDRLCRLPGGTSGGGMPFWNYPSRQLDPT